MISKTMIILAIAVAFVAGSITTGTVAYAVPNGGWQQAVADIQAQIDNIQLLPGPQGADGQDGIHCWDLNGDGINDSVEDINGDGIFDTKDCSGSDVFVIAFTPSVSEPSNYDLQCIHAAFPLDQEIFFQVFAGDGLIFVDGGFGLSSFTFSHDYGSQAGEFQVVCIVTDEMGNQEAGMTTIIIP